MDVDAVLGPVPVDLTLRVRRMDDVLALYVEGMGLVPTQHDEGVSLAPQGGAPVLHLVEDRDAPLRAPQTVGLYHFALLLPDRLALGRVTEQLRQHGAAFDGFSDHGVSEAVYLRDAEGNGIELYADRPRDAWPLRGDDIEMWTRPLDIASLIKAAGASGPLAEGTRLGHLHFHVADLDAAESFYAGVLGLDVMVRTYPGALFLATGGYHHHVGVNTWVGDRRAPQGATGIVEHTWKAPASVVEAIAERTRSPGRDHEEVLVVPDPVGARARIEPVG